MRDEVQRISKLVAAGKLSPEDAAALIDAFYESERSEHEEVHGGQSSDTPPPPPPQDDAKKSTSRDPFKALIESIEQMTKEGIENVDWHEVSKQAKQSAKRGIEQLKVGIDEISKGKINIGWVLTHEEREVSLPLAVPEGRKLRIENPAGNVRVTGGHDVGSVTAHARFRGSTIEEARAKAQTYTLIIEESDHVVEIRQPDINGMSVDLDVQLSGNTLVEIESEAGDVQIVSTHSGCKVVGRSGNISLRGLDGIIEVSTSSGNVSVEDSKGPAIGLENKSGNIRVVRSAGNLKARTASGDITITKSTGKVLSVEATYGNVTVDLDEPLNGTLNVRTVNGDATVSVPDGCDCRVKLSTIRGEVHCGFDLIDEAREESRVTGALGTGNGTLDVSAVTGNVSLDLRDSSLG